MNKFQIRGLVESFVPNGMTARELSESLPNPSARRLSESYDFTPEPAALGRRVSTKEDDEELKCDFIQYVKSGNSFSPVGEVTFVDSLGPCAYQVNLTMTGPNFERIKPKTDELMVFENSSMDRVVKEIDKFWDRKKHYQDLGLMHSRGILMYGPPGCQPAGSQVLMADGSWKNVEEIEKGDRVVSPQHDGSVIVSKVIETVIHRQQPIFKLSTKSHGGYRAAANHVVPFMGFEWKSRWNKKEKKFFKEKNCHKLYEMQVQEFNSRGNGFKKRAKMFNAPPVEFEPKSYDVHPYLLGVLLGDGNLRSYCPRIGVARKNIFERLRKLGVKLGKRQVSGICDVHCLIEESGVNVRALPVHGKLSSEKWIPEEYKRGSLSQRLDLLAGLIDTDGSKVVRGSAVFGVTSKRLAEDFLEVLFSVGGSGRITERWCKCQTGATVKCYKIRYQFGEVVPTTSVGERQVKVRNFAWKDHRRHAFSAIPDGVEDVYGFVLDSPSEWYVTDDWFVTHNTGKSACLQQVVEMMIKRGDVVFFAKSSEAVVEGLKAFRQVEPERRVVICFEEADELVRHNERALLQLMDGDAKTDNVLFLATTNYIDRLPPRMLRPGRFDKKIFIAPPSYEARLKYLRHKLAKLTEDSKIVDLARKSDGFGFGHMRELIAGIFAMGEPMEEVLTRLRVQESIKEIGGEFERV